MPKYWVIGVDRSSLCFLFVISSPQTVSAQSTLQNESTKPRKENTGGKAENRWNEKVDAELRSSYPTRGRGRRERLHHVPVVVPLDALGLMVLRPELFFFSNLYGSSIGRSGHFSRLPGCGASSNYLLLLLLAKYVRFRLERYRLRWWNAFHFLTKNRCTTVFSYAYECCLKVVFSLRCFKKVSVM